MVAALEKCDYGNYSARSFSTTGLVSVYSLLIDLDTIGLTWKADE
jgi:hypothetical protein